MSVNLIVGKNGSGKSRLARLFGFVCSRQKDGVVFYADATPNDVNSILRATKHGTKMVIVDGVTDENARKKLFDAFEGRNDVQLIITALDECNARDANVIRLSS